MTSGTIPYTELPDPVPDGIYYCLQQAGIGVARAPEGVNVTDVEAAGAFISAYAGSATQLAYMQAQALAALGDVYAAKFATGFSYAGADGLKRTFQIDPASQQNVAAQATMALVCASGSVPWPADFYWIDAENEHMPLKSPNEMLAFGAAMGAYVGKLVLTNRAWKDAIAASTDIAALQAIDLTAGWPKA